MPPLIRRAALPAAVFVAVLAAHYVYCGLFPEKAEAAPAKGAAAMKDGAAPGAASASDDDCDCAVCRAEAARANSAPADGGPQSGASPPAVPPSWPRSYLGTQSYWLGLSYAMSLTFAVAMFRRYREERRAAARNLAAGGVTLSGFLAVAGCYLLGCCGSPMLGVYLSLFGAAFLPFLKPLVTALTAVSLVGAWWWMGRRRAAPVPGAGPCAGAGCGCDAGRAEQAGAA